MRLRGTDWFYPWNPFEFSKRTFLTTRPLLPAWFRVMPPPPIGSGDLRFASVVIEIWFELLRLAALTVLIWAWAEICLIWPPLAGPVYITMPSVPSILDGPEIEAFLDPMLTVFWPLRGNAALRESWIPDWPIIFLWAEAYPVVFIIYLLLLVIIT